MHSHVLQLLRSPAASILHCIQLGQDVGQHAQSRRVLSRLHAQEGIPHACLPQTCLTVVQVGMQWACRSASSNRVPNDCINTQTQGQYTCDAEQHQAHYSAAAPLHASPPYLAQRDAANRVEGGVRLQWHVRISLQLVQCFGERGCKAICRGLARCLVWERGISECMPPERGCALPEDV